MADQLAETRMEAHSCRVFQRTSERWFNPELASKLEQAYGHCYMSRVFKEEGPSFWARKKQSSHGNFSPQQWQQPLAQCSMHSQKMCPTRSWESPHQMSLSVFQMKTFGYGWSRQCVEMVWRQKIWQARDLRQNIFSRKSETCTKSDLTHLAETQHSSQ